MRRIPYGQINFEKIIKDNYIYVDKTKYIEKLENLDETSLIYLRPGRFGKSLFTNMLDYYYAIDRADKFDTLFNNLYIKEHPTPNKNNYYILNFDFSGIDSNDEWNVEDLMEAFNSKVISGIKKFPNLFYINTWYFKNNKKRPKAIIAFNGGGYRPITVKSFRGLYFR